MSDSNYPHDQLCPIEIIAPGLDIRTTALNAVAHLYSNKHVPDPLTLTRRAKQFEEYLYSGRI